MIRATTGGVLRSYRRNLMNSFISQNNARDTVLTQRNFNSYAEDPAAAAKCFRLRKSRMTVEGQYDVCSETYHKFEGAYQCLQSTSQIIDTENAGNQLNTVKSTTLRMLNDPTGDARTQLSKALDQMSENFVQNMNQTYGDVFIFAGADGHNVPFEIKTENGQNRLYYRGVPVDAAEPEVYQNNGANVTLDDNGNVGAGDQFLVTAGVKTISETDYLNNQNDPAAKKVDVLMDGADPTQPYAFTDEDGKTYYILKDSATGMTQAEMDKASEDARKLNTLINEKQFVDIGLGFKEDNGKLIESSAFNAALQGITFLGYGVDEDGDPKNVYSIVQRLKEIADSVPDGEDWSGETWDEFDALVGKLEKAASNYKTEFTNFAASTTKLKTNLQLLDETKYNLQEQYSEMEDVDAADAISAFIWAQYSYNAALKVGNSILSESLMDYLS